VAQPEGGWRTPTVFQARPFAPPGQCSFYAPRGVSTNVARPHAADHLRGRAQMRRREKGWRAERLCSGSANPVPRGNAPAPRRQGEPMRGQRHTGWLRCQSDSCVTPGLCSWASPEGKTPRMGLGLAGARLRVQLVARLPA